MMNTIAKIRMKRLEPVLCKGQAFYLEKLSKTQHLAWQLNQFNQVWTNIKQTVPFYSQLTKSQSLPEQFQSWEQIVDSLPIINRNTIQKHLSQLTSQAQPPQWSRTTGGSTSQPIQLPAWHSEKAITAPNTWLGRSSYNVSATDKLFMIWGHSHLLGTGIKGKVNGIKRQIFDSLLGYHRFSAYNLSQEKLAEAAEAILRFRPQYILGYSVALDALARSNQHLTKKFHELGLKVVIGTAESFPSEDSALLIEEVFGAPIAMEYGSVETDVIAHSQPTGFYNVFWRNYFLEAQEKGITGGRILRITSLYPRAFPLIRYEIGDEIELMSDDSSGLGVSEFSRVIGRCNDFILLEDGIQIHSEAITHCVRTSAKITGYQLLQIDNTTHLRLTVSSPLLTEEMNEIRYKLGKINQLLEKITIESVDHLQQTIAGKTRMVVRNSSK